MDLQPKSVAREVVVVIVVVVLLHWLGSLGDLFLIGAFNDDGVYTVLAKALAEGQGYHSLHLVGAPVHVKFPPGFPGILSVLWRWTGSVEGLHRVVQWLHPLVLGLAAGLLWALARARWRLGWGPALVLVVLPLVLDATIQYATIPLAEPWFILGWASVLVTWEAAAAARNDRRPVLLGLTGLLAAGTVLIRSQGIVLVPAIIAGLFVRRHTRVERAATLGMMLLPLAAWHLYHRAIVAAGPLPRLPDEATYSTWFPSGGVHPLQAAVAIALANVRLYVGQLGGDLTAVRPLGVVLIGLLLLGTTAAGLKLARHKPVPALGVLGSLALVFLWPFAQSRLLLSSLPVGGLLGALALEPRLARLPEQARRWINVASVVAVALVLVRQVDIRRDSLAAAAENRAPRFLSPSYILVVNSRFIAAASHWVLANSAPDSRIMTDLPSGIFLYTGRRTMPASPSESPLVPSVFAVPGRYLAQHILDDSLTLVMVVIKEAGIMRDLATVKARCPGVLTWAGVAPSDPRDLYRVSADRSCLRKLAAE